MGLYADLRTAAQHGWTLREVQADRENKERGRQHQAAELIDLKRREVEALEKIAKAKSK